MTATRLLEQMTREEVRRRGPSSTAIIPTAAIEQHGPHLPICTDQRIASAIAERAAQAASDSASILVVPTLAYGLSAHHFPFPGVLSLTRETFIEAVAEIGGSLTRSGFRRIFILNAHGGNDEAVRLAAKEINERWGVLCGAASYWTIAWNALVEAGAAFGITRLPGHAGAFETAMMRVLEPDLIADVAMPEVIAAPARALPTALRPLVLRPSPSDGVTGGYSDDPAVATAEAGERLLEAAVNEVARFLIDFATIPID
jgi:creatinine amidohydrolase